MRHERTQCVDACTVCLRAELAAARAVLAELTDVRAALESLRTRVAMASARAVDAGFLGYDPSRPDMAEALAKDAKAAGLAVPLTEGGGVMPIRDVFIGEGDAAAQKRVDAAMKEGRKLVETLLQRVCRENEELRADLAAARKVIAKLNDTVGAMDAREAALRADVAAARAHVEALVAGEAQDAGR